MLNISDSDFAQLPFDLAEFAENLEPRCPVLLLDLSAAHGEDAGDLHRRRPTLKVGGQPIRKRSSPSLTVTSMSPPSARTKARRVASSVFSRSPRSMRETRDWEIPSRRDSSS